jgi:hypothetical protein
VTLKGRRSESMPYVKKKVSFGEALQESSFQIDTDYILGPTIRCFFCAKKNDSKSPSRVLKNHFSLVMYFS